MRLWWRVMGSVMGVLGIVFQVLHGEGSAGVEAVVFMMAGIVLLAMCDLTKPEKDNQGGAR